ncbi:hypothetical protein ACEPPN_014462 [Leptodophora sp. 'Broadleaf-Isolate-01']
MATNEKIVKLLIILYRFATLPPDFGAKDVCPYHMSPFWKLITLLLVLDAVGTLVRWRPWGWCVMCMGVDMGLDEIVGARGEEEKMEVVRRNVAEESWRIWKGNYGVGEWVGVFDDL